MRIYLVWCRGHRGAADTGVRVGAGAVPMSGATKERIEAYDEVQAAERWAEMADRKSANYTIVRGAPADVVVAEDRDGAPELSFRVTGKTVPVYSAWVVRYD